jgi:hypothetical protein
VLRRDLAEEALRLGPALLRKRGLRERELKLADVLVRWEKALPLVLLPAVRIEDDEDRRPLDAEALERLRLLLDVHLHW